MRGEEAISCHFLQEIEFFSRLSFSVGVEKPEEVVVENLEGNFVDELFLV